MKTDSEKEKKLISALNKLKSLNLQNPTLKNNLENLSSQKNQLEIEKKEIEAKYQNLMDEHNTIKKKLEDIQKQKVDEQKKETEFSATDSVLVLKLILEISKFIFCNISI